MDLPGEPLEATVLPADISLEFLAEGAANIVFHAHFPTSSDEFSATKGQNGGTTSSANVASEPPDDLLSGRLLRLRKALPSTVPNAIAARWFQHLFSSLLPPENVVNQILVEMPLQVLQNCNASLRKLEATGRRLASRCGLYLAENEPHGFLITDMTPRKDNGEVLLEFKPKWLVQSPSAPTGSKRCRTCALRAQRNSVRRSRGEPNEVSFCPLDLVSGDPERICQAVQPILDKTLEASSKRAYILSRLVDFLLHDGLLRRLRQLQIDLDPLGVFAADPTSRDFLIATTLRDCSLYLKVNPSYVLYRPCRA
ncbi:MAG: Inositol-pentakisphosphate 2-kinase [Caeruleum heppii]|nr:MAG: Inositol-pentakisphosphate 2-kinase [Caeruleum heppii]